MIHELECAQPWFEDVYRGDKTFEVRYDDREFAIGDYLLFQELTQDREGLTGRTCAARVDYIFRDYVFGLLTGGVVVMGISVVQRLIGGWPNRDELEAFLALPEATV